MAGFSFGDTMSGLQDKLTTYTPAQFPKLGGLQKFITNELANIATSIRSIVSTFGLIQNNKTTVSNLPTAASSQGQRYLVTDATATTFWSIVAGGGANTVPVTSDGTSWRIG